MGVYIDNENSITFSVCVSNLKGIEPNQLKFIDNKHYFFIPKLQYF